jgi:hypothetical protein
MAARFVLCFWEALTIRGMSLLSCRCLTGTFQVWRKAFFLALALVPVLEFVLLWLKTAKLHFFLF